MESLCASNRCCRQRTTINSASCSRVYTTASPRTLRTDNDNVRTFLATVRMMSCSSRGIRPFYRVVACGVTARLQGEQSRTLLDFRSGHHRLRSSGPAQARGRSFESGVRPGCIKARAASDLLDRGCSSAGRALQSHCRGQGFDPPQLHRCVRMYRLRDKTRRRSVGRRVPMTVCVVNL